MHYSGVVVAFTLIEHKGIYKHLITNRTLDGSKEKKFEVVVNRILDAMEILPQPFTH